MDFITIDFEIANRNLSSACSLGIVFVENNQIVDEKYYLIKPPHLNFSNDMSNIHGLKAEDVINEKKFHEIWEEIQHYFVSNTIIAHNAQFDMSVLHACLSEYNLDIPDFNYQCSIPISTGAIIGKVSNSLTERLKYFDIELEDHHNALADAKACAQMVITCINKLNKSSLDEYCRSEFIHMKAFSDLKAQKSLKKKWYTGTRVKISEIAATVETYDETHTLFGKSVVFTGELTSIERKDAMQKVVDLGGLVKSGVSSKTNYLVVGAQDKAIVGEDGLSSKEEKAYALIEKGINIKIIKENEFIRLLESKLDWRNLCD